MTEKHSTGNADEAPPWSHRFAHRGTQSYLAVAGVSVVSALVTDGTLSVVLPIACIAANVVLFRATLQHQRDLCTICASMTPLDGVTEARRATRDLRRVHRPRLFVAVWFGPCGLAVVVNLLWFIGIIDAPPSWLRLPATVPLSYIAQALWLKGINCHTVLAPWCPFCQWRRDPSNSNEPSPDTGPVTDTRN